MPAVLGWVEMGWGRFGWVELGWYRLGWVGIDRNGLGFQRIPIHPSPYQPTCDESWPIRVEFNDGSKYTNGSLKTCTINMAESKSSANTRHCLDQAFNGFENGTSPDWIVYITAGYNARILWYHDFSDALIKRYGP